VTSIAHMGESSKKSISHFICFEDSARYQDTEHAPIPEVSPGSLTSQAFKHSTRDLDLKSHPKE
jgi:hypothetical protein